MTGLTGPVVLHLPEEDYLYGAGTLRIRVHQVDTRHPYQYDGDDWYPVAGTRLSRDGAELRPMRVFVRARQLPAALLR